MQMAETLEINSEVIGIYVGIRCGCIETKALYKRYMHDDSSCLRKLHKNATQPRE